MSKLVHGDERFLSASGENVVLTPKLTVQLRCIKTWSKLGSEAALSVTEIANATFCLQSENAHWNPAALQRPESPTLGTGASVSIPKLGSPSPGRGREINRIILRLPPAQNCPAFSVPSVARTECRVTGFDTSLRSTGGGLMLNANKPSEDGVSIGRVAATG